MATKKKPLPKIHPTEKTGRPVPTIQFLTNQAHSSLDNVLKSAVEGNHETYQLALMNLTDCIALARFADPKDLELDS